MLFGSILSVSPATDVAFRPPNVDMPSTQMPSMAPNLSGQVFMPPRTGVVPHGVMPKSIPQVPGMLRHMSPIDAIPIVPQNLVTADSLSSIIHPVSRISTGGAPCTEERHPAMSPLNAIPPGVFPKQTSSPGIPSLQQ